MSDRTGSLPTKTRILYGFGSVAYGIKDNGFSSFLLFYYNQVIGLRADLVSLAIALALVIDAFVDPLISRMTDRTRTRLGSAPSLAVRFCCAHCIVLVVALEPSPSQ